MNIEEMRILLQGTIQECESVEIPTLKYEDLKGMRLIWYMI